MTMTPYAHRYACVTLGWLLNYANRLQYRTWSGDHLRLTWFFVGGWLLIVTKGESVHVSFHWRPCRVRAATASNYYDAVEVISDDCALVELRTRRFAANSQLWRLDVIYNRMFVSEGKKLITRRRRCRPFKSNNKTQCHKTTFYGSHMQVCQVATTSRLRT